MGVPARARAFARLRRALRRLPSARGPARIAAAVAALVTAALLVAATALAGAHLADLRAAHPAADAHADAHAHAHAHVHAHAHPHLHAHPPDESRSESTPSVQVARAQAYWRDVMETGIGGGDGLHGPWEEVMDDVAVVVKTGAEVSGERLKTLREKGWMSVGRRVPNLLVIGDSEAPGVVGMKRYGLELLSDAERHEREHAAAPVVRSTGHVEEATGQAVAVAVGNVSRPADFVDTDALNGVDDSALVHDTPEKWFSMSGWKGDKDKNLPAFHLLATVYPGKKWYIMVDDDTYIFLDNFAAFLKRRMAEFPPQLPFYSGKIFYVANCAAWAKDGTNREQKGGPRAGFAHGGSGIVLNRAAMDAMYPAVAGCMHEYSKCWAGDMQVSLCLRQRGVKPMRYNGGRSFERHFTPFSASSALGDKRYTARLKSGASPITFHKAPAAEIALLSEYEREVRKKGLAVIYRPLLTFLLERNLLPTWPKKKTGHETHILDKSHPAFVPVD